MKLAGHALKGIAGCLLDDEDDFQNADHHRWSRCLLESTVMGGTPSCRAIDLRAGHRESIFHLPSSIFHFSLQAQKQRATSLEF
jgi:hypothetical protein